VAPRLIVGRHGALELPQPARDPGFSCELGLLQGPDVSDEHLPGATDGYDRLPILSNMRTAIVAEAERADDRLADSRPGAVPQGSAVVR
jgi:hypothetical protein